MDDIYNNNLKALKVVDPSLEVMIRAIESNLRFEVLITDNSVINIFDNQKQLYFYQNPQEALNKRIEETKTKENFPYRYQFGVGNGTMIQYILQNNSVRRLIVFEPNIEMLYVVLNIFDLSQEILSKRLTFLGVEKSFEEIFDLLNNNNFNHIHFVRVYELEIESDYYTNYTQDMNYINQTMIRVFEYFLRAYGNDVTDTLMGIEHHTQNFRLMFQNPTYKDLTAKKNTKVAVIVATGPSLQKQLPLLKKIEDYVTIISVDASFPVLIKNNIRPDIVTTLERTEATAFFYEKTTKEQQDGSIFLLASLVHKKLIKEIEGGEKVIAMRPHDWAKYYGFDDYGYVGYGMSAANMAYDLSIDMGFKNVILIGQDLSFASDGKSHTQDHVYGENDEQNPTVKKQKEDNIVPETIQISAYGGKGLVNSTHIWKMFLNNYEIKIAENKDNMDVYNATEGGARIDGTIELSFKDVIEKLVDFSNKKEKIILQYPTKEQTKNNIDLAYNKLLDILKYSFKVQKRVEKSFLVVAKASDELERLNKENKLDTIDFKNLERISNEYIIPTRNLVEEEKFYNLFKNTVISSLAYDELELAKISVMYDKTDIDSHVKLIEWIMKHKHWLFTLAGIINAQRDVIKRAIRNCLSNPTVKPLLFREWI